MAADLKDAGHSLSFVHALIGIARHRAHVVGEQPPAALRRPLQDERVIFPRQPCILNANDINGRISSPDTADDVVVKVLVGREWQHLRIPCRISAIAIARQSVVSWRGGPESKLAIRSSN